MRTCARCRQSLPHHAFRRKLRRGRENLQPYCIECNKQYHREHYLANKADYGRKARVNATATIAKNRTIILDHLLANPCVDCGETDPVVLEMDHRDRKTKSATVSQLVRETGPDRLMAEIAKCDVRCCNCHRRKTVHDLGWWRASL